MGEEDVRNGPSRRYSAIYVASVFVREPSQIRKRSGAPCKEDVPESPVDVRMDRARGEPNYESDAEHDRLAGHNETQVDDPVPQNNVGQSDHQGQIEEEREP